MLVNDLAQASLPLSQIKAQLAAVKNGAFHHRQWTGELGVATDFVLVKSQLLNSLLFVAGFQVKPQRNEAPFNAPRKFVAVPLLLLVRSQVSSSYKPKKTFLSTSQKQVSTCNAWFHCLSPTFCYLQLAPGSFRIPHRHTRWWTWSVLATRDVSHGQVSWLGYPYWGISILKKWLLNMIIYIIIYSIIYILYYVYIIYIYYIVYYIYIILYIILYYLRRWIYKVDFFT